MHMDHAKAVLVCSIADGQRQIVRKNGGEMLIWRETRLCDGQVVAGGRHYWEDIEKEVAAARLRLLANGAPQAEPVRADCCVVVVRTRKPRRNGALPMLYCGFLTALLLHRAKRYEEISIAKYGRT